MSLSATNAIALKEARFCSGCETIHTDRKCPACGSLGWIWMTNWLNRPETPKRSLEISVVDNRIYVEVAR